MPLASTEDSWSARVVKLHPSLGASQPRVVWEVGDARRAARCCVAEVSDVRCGVRRIVEKVGMPRRHARDHRSRDGRSCTVPLARVKHEEARRPRARPYAAA